MIYVLNGQYKKVSVFKVGFSLNPIRRIPDIQTNCPFKLSLVALRSGTLKDERAFHKLLVKFKTNGEWFQDTPETRAILDIPNGLLVDHKKSPLGSLISFMETNRNYSFNVELICNVFKLDYHRLDSYYHQGGETSPIRIEGIDNEDLQRINYVGKLGVNGYVNVVSHCSLFNEQIGGYERFHNYHSRITPFNKHLIPEKWLEPKYPYTYFLR